MDIIYTDELVAKGVLLALLAMQLWGLLIFVLFGRTSWFCWVMGDFILWGIAGFALAGVLLVRDVNVTMPQAAPVLHRQEVLEKICTLRCKQSCGKSCTRRREYALEPDGECSPAQRPMTLRDHIAQDSVCASHAWFEYKMTVAKWPSKKLVGRKQETTYKFETQAGVFDAARVNGTVVVPVYAGAMGIEWLDVTAIRNDRLSVVRERVVPVKASVFQPYEGVQ